MQKLKQIESGILSGNFVDVSGITIYDLAKQIQDDKRNYNEIQLQTYLRNMETLKPLKDIYMTPIQKANSLQMRDFLLSKISYSQSLLNKIYIMLNSTFQEAIKRNIIVENPLEDVRKPKSTQIKRETRALTIDEQYRLLHVLQTQDVNYSSQMLLSMFTGLRMGEINALEIKNIDFTSNSITVNNTISKVEKGRGIVNDTPKTAAGNRKVQMNIAAVAIMQDCTKYVSEGLIFKNKDGKPITTNQVNMRFKRILNKYDILDKTIDGKVSAHSLRHTYATRCAEGNMSAPALQKLLGHTDIRVTYNTYFSSFDRYTNSEVSKVDGYLKDVGLTLIDGTKEDKIS